MSTTIHEPPFVRDAQAELDDPFQSLKSKVSRFFDALGIGPDEIVPICHQEPGGAFCVLRGKAKDAAALAAPYVGKSNLWFSVNPVRPDADLRPGQRGGAKDVARLTALWADLDAKPFDKGGLGSSEVCAKAVDRLAAILGGAQPVAVVGSGTGGLHPYWRLAPYEPAQHPRAVRLTAWFGVVVRAVAWELGGSADNVFDPARVMRLPGSFNRKDNGGPVTLKLASDDPEVVLDILTLDDLEERLSASGVREEPIKTTARLPEGATLAMQDWAKSQLTCRYTQSMVQGWPTDIPQAGLQRRRWCLSQAVRLLEALRLGCLAHGDLMPAVKALEERFIRLHALNQLKPEPREFFGILAWAQTADLVPRHPGPISGIQHRRDALA